MKATRTYLKRVVIFSLILLATLVFGSAADAQINSVDLSFNAIPDKDAASPANFILQPDGKIIVFGNFQVVNGVLNNQIARLNPDGSLDNTFNCTACNFGIGSAILQPDGKIIVAGGTSDNSSTSAVVYRLTSDGSRDFSFTSAFAPVGFPNSQWASVRTVQPDGKILVVLSSSASGFTSDSLYRLNPDGTFDVSFTPAAVGGGRLVRQILGKILVLPDGKILVAANTFSAGNSSAALLRFNADGTRDMTFEAPNFSPSGSLPGSFVSDMELLADGSILIVGRFTGINAVSRQNVAKLLPAGNVDLSFNNSNIGEATGIEVLPNGKFLISTASRFYRLNPDGSLDLTFNSPSSLTQINSWAVDASGNIVVNGAFFNNASVNTFARLNADGSIANSFTVGFGVSASITTLAAQADGKVIFAGDFTRVGGVRRVSIARVNADGSLDTTFNANNGFDNVVEKIVVQPDGKILVGGQFNSFNNVSTEPGLVRLNADGSADVNFNFHSILPPSTVVYAIAVQPDGKIIIGGVFGIVNGLTRTGIARLNADGTIDASFNPVFGNAAIRSIVVEANGK
ncbi:MAG TPA: hypothetical protein VK308_16935, partial [Pyrinomonadaceae bacterium]|nr:hypothetical protein [Pyrinomonadaceae bacterium]